MKITRDVVSDLWPLYFSGEASADTRALVEDFLAADPDFASTLRASTPLPEVEVALPPDHELRALSRTRELVQGGRWARGVRLVALVLTVLAIVRLGADDTETVVARVAVAAIAWVIYIVLVWRQRSAALRSTTARTRAH